MAYGPSQLVNLANMTVERNIGKDGHKYSDISLTDQNFVCKRLLEMGNVVEKSGPQLKFNCMVDFAETTKWSGLFDTDTPTVNNNTQKKGTVNWSKLVTSMTWDEDEPEFQPEDITIVDVMEERMHQAYNSRFTFLEPAIFSQPTSSSQENPPITGLPHWLVPAATAVAGFNGADPTGFTDGAAGIDADTYINWKNYNIGYNGAVGWDNFVDPLLQGLDFTNFVSPHPYPKLSTGKTDATKFLLTTYPVKRGLRKLLRKSNENVRYVDMFNDEGDVIKGTALIWSAYLNRVAGSDNGTIAAGFNDPLYAINFKYLFVAFQKGKKENWKKPILRANTHTVWDKFLDSWLAVFTPNRRELGFVMNRIA
jgi:hypothetical protein